MPQRLKDFNVSVTPGDRLVDFCYRSCGRLNWESHCREIHQRIVQSLALGVGHLHERIGVDPEGFVWSCARSLTRYSPGSTNAPRLVMSV